MAGHSRESFPRGPSAFPEDRGRIHFVGIGGVGMSGIAEVLLNLGYRVSGSDLEPTELTRRLAKAGARVFSGHDAAWARDASAVVVSSAVPDSNPEVRAARRAKIPVLRRAQALAELARLKKTVTVSGSHGKTTTTSMTAMALQAAGADPTMIIGGQLKNIGSNARLGRGKYLVAEADESDGSFLYLKPLVAVVTNVDNDHLDHYKTMARIEDAFLKHLGSVLPGGACVVCADDPVLSRLVAGLCLQFPSAGGSRGRDASDVRRRNADRPQVIRYGLKSPAQWRARNIRLSVDGSRFDLVHRGKRVAAARLRVPGRHNVLNALGAVAAGAYLGFPVRKLLRGLAEFRGVGRRLESLGKAGGVAFLDDYGHHPTEIRATLEAVRELYRHGPATHRRPHRLSKDEGRGACESPRLIVIFQPHRYTRTKLLHREFGPAFRAADRVFLMDIYAAGEKPIRGVTSDLILRSLRRAGIPARFLLCAHERSSARVVDLARELRPGDVVLTLGAGDVWKIGEDLKRRLAEGAPARY